MTHFVDSTTFVFSIRQYATAAEMPEYPGRRTRILSAGTGAGRAVCFSSRSALPRCPSRSAMDPCGAKVRGTPLATRGSGLSLGQVSRGVPIS